MTRRKKPAPPVCKVDACKARIYTRGLCALHWCSRADLADPVPAIPGPPSVLKTGPEAA